MNFWDVGIKLMSRYMLISLQKYILTFELNNLMFQEAYKN